MELNEEEERQRWWLSVMQQAVATQSDHRDDSSSVLERGRAAASRRDAAGSTVSAPSAASSPQSMRASRLLVERDQLRQNVAELEARVAELEGSRFEPPELEELQALCSTLEFEKRRLEEQLLQFQRDADVAPQSAEVSLTEREQSEKIETLELQNSKLQDDLWRERDDHSKVEAELQEEKTRLKELQDQLTLLKVEYQEKYQDAGKADDMDLDQSASIKILELQHAKLQDELFNERRLRSRLEAELEMERGELAESEQRLMLLETEYEKLQTSDSQKVRGDLDSARMETLELQNSKLQDELFNERHHRTRLEGELEMERGELAESQQRLALLQAEHEERFQMDEEKASGVVASLEVRLQELEQENLRLSQERLAERLVTSAMEEAQEELKRQAEAKQGGSASSPTAPSKAKPSELSELLAVDSPGVYVVSQTVTLTVGPEKNSAKIQHLNAGTVVHVLEVMQRLEDRRVRGRVEEPAGWISLISTEDSTRWAQRDLARSNAWVSGSQQRLMSLQRELDALEASSSLAQQSRAEEATKSRQTQQDLETQQAEAAEDLHRREREVHELQEKQRKMELQLQQMQMQIDSPGVYILSGDVDVCETASRHSQKVGRLVGGQEVQVLEVIHREAERRVRGRVVADGVEGWISLLDTGGAGGAGHRWAHRQLAATAEWIRELQAGAGPAGPAGPSGLGGAGAFPPSEVLELRARCAGLEAQRDSLLNELNSLSPGAAKGVAAGDANELQELRGKVLLLEANREELGFQAELMGAKYAALQAEHEELQLQLSEVNSDAAVALGRSLQVSELQRQVDEQVMQRGRLEAELARLRAEHGALTANPMVVSENPLAQAERWVLYTEIPKVEETPSLSYPGPVHVNFDDEELLGILGPLAAVNFSSRVNVVGALERGDAARAALKAFCQEDVQGRGYLDASGVRAFVASVFQHHGLTPPMEAHVLPFYQLFSEEEPLDARGCLCLCDALMRAVLRASGRSAGRASVPVAVTQGHDENQSTWTWTEPREEQQSVPAPASKCRFCGEELEEDSLFCTACGARRLDMAPASPIIAPSSRGLPASPSHAAPPRLCQACGHLLSDDSDFCTMCGQRYVAPNLPAPVVVPLVPPKALDPSRIRTCRPVSAEMARSLQAPPVVRGPMSPAMVVPPAQVVAPPSMPVTVTVPYVRSQ